MWFIQPCSRLHGFKHYYTMCPPFTPATMFSQSHISITAPIHAHTCSSTCGPLPCPVSFHHSSLSQLTALILHQAVYPTPTTEISFNLTNMERRESTNPTHPTTQLSYTMPYSATFIFFRSSSSCQLVLSLRIKTSRLISQSTRSCVFC